MYTALYFGIENDAIPLAVKLEKQLAYYDVSGTGRVCRGRRTTLSPAVDELRWLVMKLRIL